MHIFKKLLYLCLGLLGLFFAAVIFVNKLNSRIEQAVETGWFPPSIEYYSAPVELKPLPSLSIKQVRKELIQRNYIFQISPELLRKGEFTRLSEKECFKILKTQKNIDSCFMWISAFPPHLKNLILFRLQPPFVEFYQGAPLQLRSSLFLDPVLFAQHEGGSLRLRKKFQLNEAPLVCLQAVTLTEDQNFLLHKGASPAGILRAFFRNIKNLKIKEGGSTITQQLIKNKFLSPKKTFRRKAVELIMALLLERKLNKDQILELYLNTVYMGRTSSYSIYGFASAAQYYFNKPLSRCGVKECSLLSAIVQSPGKFNPFSNPETARKRRRRTLENLLKHKFITQKEFDQAIAAPLPSLTQKTSKAPGSYLAAAAYHFTKKKLNSFPLNQDLKVQTALDLSKQKKARQAIQKALKILDERVRKTKIKTAEGGQKFLEAALVHLDLKTNQVQALAGGRNFHQSPFNRAVEAQRPIGSLVKPFLFLSSLSRQSSLHPMSYFLDKPFSKNAKWSPKNYKNQYHGDVPLYFALKESLNSVSVRLGMKTTLEALLSDFKKLGLQKKIQKNPSITLGAVDLSPMEISQMYSTIARMGSYLPLSLIQKIQNTKGSILFQNNAKEKIVFSKEKTAVLIGMMKQVILSGTAQWVRPFISFPAAGKTGTSNKEKDSWFVGFTPQSLTTVWVGYDDNSPHQLTGAGGALLVWFYFMQSLQKNSEEDFQWPAGVEEKEQPHFYSSLQKKQKKTFHLEPLKLIFEKQKKKKWYKFLLKKP